MALGQADGTFGAPELKLGSFGYDQGWRVGEHPRLLGDVNGDGRDDIVGFGHAGTYVSYVSYGQADSTFTAPALKLQNFGLAQGWTEDRFPRELGDVNGDGRDDVVGFGYSSTFVELF